jgi:IPT/TIG domain
VYRRLVGGSSSRKRDDETGCERLGRAVPTAAATCPPAAPAAPGITKLKPASGKCGATVTISGSGFGGARGASSVQFGSKTCIKCVSWSDTRIKCRVPVKAKYGTVKVTVTTTAGASNAKSFKVKR